MLRLYGSDVAGLCDDIQVLLYTYYFPYWAVAGSPLTQPLYSMV